MPSNDSSADEQIHKWKRCGCGHPQHSSMCLAGDGRNFCRCLEVTSRADIADICRRTGGCSVHRTNTETAGEPEAQPTGCIRDAGCRDIFHGCLGGCDAAADELTVLRQDMEATEPKARGPWPCGDCGAMVPAGQDWCTACNPEPKASGLPCPEGGDCRRSVECPDGCRRLIPEGPVASRPPFLVAYATGSGALNELALPGDATVAVVDGSLVISHAAGVLGIQHVKPLEGQ